MSKLDNVIFELQTSYAILLNIEFQCFWDVNPLAK